MLYVSKEGSSSITAGRIGPETLPKPKKHDSDLDSGSIGLISDIGSVYFFEDNLPVNMTDLDLGKACIKVVNLLKSRDLLLDPEIERDSGDSFEIAIVDDQFATRSYEFVADPIWIDFSPLTELQREELFVTLHALVSEIHPDAVIQYFEYRRA